MKQNKHPFPWRLGEDFATGPYVLDAAGCIVLDENGSTKRQVLLQIITAANEEVEREGEQQDAHPVKGERENDTLRALYKEVQDGIGAAKRGDVVPHEEVVRELGERPKPPDAPAFPHNGWEHKGMTLRDWFAGQLIADYMACPSDNPDTMAKLATWAYDLADAMLAEREKRVNGTA